MNSEKFTVTPEQIKEFQEATLMDDYFMRKFFDGNIPGVQLVLRIIMDKPDLIVKSVKVQQNLLGFGEAHSVRFDVYAVDSEYGQYDIEFQNDADGADPNRADFNSAMMTVRTLMKNEHYSVLAKRKRVVIFITKTDVLKGGYPIYRIDRVIREMNRDFGDNSHIIYVNTSHKDTATALGKLIHDFRCKNAQEWYYTDLADQAKELKGGNISMSAIREMEKHAREVGRADMQESIATGLIRLGKLALEDIANVCHLTLEQVKNLAATLNA